MPALDYAAERQAIMDEEVIYIEPHQIGLLPPHDIAAGVKFYVPRGSYGWVWRCDSMMDTQKDEQIAIAERMRGRLLGKFGWLWVRWFRLLSKFDRFTWWLYRGRGI